MSDFSRRAITKLLLASGASTTLSGCAEIIKFFDRSLPHPVAPPPDKSLVDIHAHAFNSTDLPAREFILQVVLEHHEPTGSTKELRSDFRRKLVQLFLLLIGTGRSPNAKTELALLRRGAKAAKLAADQSDTDEIAIEAIARFLAEGSAFNKQAAQSGLREELLRAGAPGLDQAKLKSISTQSARSIARRAFYSLTTIGRYSRWFSLFLKYRHELVDQLIDYHRQKHQFEPVLIAPAIVDYSRWLKQEPQSTLLDQVRVMAAVSARNGDRPAVHGYVPFDPLRQIYWDQGFQHDEKISPLALVRRAITNYGFLGVKLYPPMGFKAYDNQSETKYHLHIRRELGEAVFRSLGKRLDDALTALYAYCEANNVPILTHSLESIGSNEDFAKRADPAYWLLVFSQFPELRVNFAHSGYFQSKSAEPVGAKRPDYSWEWTIGNHIRTYREERGSEAPVFMDFSYVLHVIQGTRSHQAKIAKYTRRFVRLFDPECRHMMFGTDWMMLGRERNYDEYTTKMYAFMKDQCGFDQPRLDRFFRENALQFAGLGVGQDTRARLLDFYLRNGIRRSRLPLPSTSSIAL